VIALFADLSLVFTQVLLEADKFPAGLGIMFHQLLAPFGNGLRTFGNSLVLLGLLMGHLLSHVGHAAVWLIAARERGESGDGGGGEREKTFHGTPFC